MRLYDFFANICRQPVIFDSLKFALASSVLGAAVRYTDTDAEWNYLKSILPNDDVYKGFSSTVALLLVFRTVQSLGMYREGARNAYSMAGAWFDSASTLIAFCRKATAPEEAVYNFKHTLVRLFSLLSMLCLTELENSQDAQNSHAMYFDVIDVDGLDIDTLKLIKASKCKAEIVCQMIQCLVVDNLETGVLNVPPPILSRSFQDLGNGMLSFHGTMNLSHVALPIPLLIVTDCLLALHALLTPFWMASWAQGPYSAAWSTCIQVFVLFTLNGVAREVENPFSGDINDVDIEKIHYDMNIRLAALVNLSDTFSPKACIKSLNDRTSVVDQLEHQASRRIKKMRNKHQMQKIHKKAAAMDELFDQILARSAGRLELMMTLDIALVRGPCRNDVPIGSEHRNVLHTSPRRPEMDVEEDDTHIGGIATISSTTTIGQASSTALDNKDGGAAGRRPESNARGHTMAYATAGRHGAHSCNQGRSDSSMLLSSLWSPHASPPETWVHLEFL